MPEKDGFTHGTMYIDYGDGTLVEFSGIETVSSLCTENEEDVCPAAIWPGDDPISFEIDMKRRDHRKFMKMLRSWITREHRRTRNRKRVKEQARRAILKWNALHPHQEHSL